jgi:hypothetical protein
MIYEASKRRRVGRKKEKPGREDAEARRKENCKDMTLSHDSVIGENKSNSETV